MTKLPVVAFALLVTVGCAAPWSQPPHVLITSIPGAKLVAEADVIAAPSCVAPRCRPVEASEILIMFDQVNSGVMYQLNLGTGSCEKPVVGRILAAFIGPDGTRAYIPTPVAELTSGKYLILLGREGNASVADACGAIKRAWPW